MLIFTVVSSYIKNPLPESSGYDCRKSLFFQKVLVLNPYPQTSSPWEGAILLGLPPLVQARMLVVSHTKPLHDAVAQMADDLYGGYAPKQGRFGCLPKVLHDAKPTKQATLETPFSINKRFFDKLKSTARKQWISFIFGFSKSQNSESVLSYCNRR